MRKLLPFDDVIMDDPGWVPYIKGLVQDCNNFSVLAMELLQSCTKLFIVQDWHLKG